MSRYRSFCLEFGGEVVERHCVMKSWRRGFMRWRIREGPCGSHHDDASAVKWDTSVGSTVELGVGLWCFGAVVEMHREAIGGCRNGVCLAGVRLGGVCEMALRIEPNALAVSCGFIMIIEACSGLFVPGTRGAR
jgi:hypothetical protein